MKHNDKIALINSEASELVKQAGEIRAKLSQMKVDRFTKPAKNIRETKNLHLKLAVILTALQQKELAHGK
jgi:hypothetical protein